VGATIVLKGHVASVEPETPRRGVRDEAEKRNQFSFVCIFVMLDRNLPVNFFHIHKLQFRIHVFSFSMR